MYSDKQESVVIKLPKTFADEAKKRGANYYDYQNVMNLIWADGSIYVCQRKIGRGKYSEVFEGLNTNNSQKCVVKMLKPMLQLSLRRLIARQRFQWLLMVKKMQQNYSIQSKKAKSIALYFSMSRQQIINHCQKSLLLEIAMLKGLHYCHSMGIMHRDIKPQNLAINHQTKTLRILDWGLGEFYLPKKDYNVRVCSRYFKGPELLVKYEYYHYSLDIWSLSVVMAGMIFLKQPFFKGADDMDQLQQITKVLGTEELFHYTQKYKISLSLELERALGNNKGIKLSTLVNQKNSHLATPDAIDLIEKMMVYDHNQRWTALECINHPYFDQVRESRFNK